MQGCVTQRKVIEEAGCYHCTSLLTQGYSTAEIQTIKDHVHLLPLSAMILGPVHSLFNCLAVTHLASRKKEQQFKALVDILERSFIWLVLFNEPKRAVFGRNFKKYLKNLQKSELCITGTKIF